ncbi:major facilitator superfamily-domain-containing protein [Irpex rosettiformis]|uniref:Major facilitator superfamily-domain-containing protein n=1 Tax=Irpex rosettiformis TaxID=378272 RepID=A0ACB8TQW9_9APHY|nr:major facilitator superfamily-domain-containing protein [Irpex rosettiformis]
MSSPPSSDAPVPSSAQTFVDGRIPQRYSAAKRYTLLVIFCLAQFLDAMNNCALFSAIPSLVIDLNMTQNESTWIIAGFQLTFASFLLISGRISDVYNPKLSFVTGIFMLGMLSIGAGFVRSKIVLIVLRALSGLAASLTIPSALSLLVDVFPEKKEQARAIGIFGGCGAVGNVLGLIIGAIFVQYANWSWVFWFVAIIATLIAVSGTLVIPGGFMPRTTSEPGRPRWKALDMGGVSILTAALILFIFAVTSGGAATGWGTPTVIAPLIISVVMVAGFFFYEAHIPVATAAVPPPTWFLPNFSSLFGVALMPFFWWTVNFTTLTPLWQDVYKWSAISVALRMIPITALSLVISFSGTLSDIFPPKYILIVFHLILIVATVLLALANSPDKYFSYILPAFILGSCGAMGVYTHTNIAIFRCVPASMAGTVGAIFNCALQLGSAVSLAAVSSIETSLEVNLPKNDEGIVTDYKGRAAAFWFLLAVVVLELLNVTVFYKVEQTEKGRDVESKGEGEVCEK